MSADVDSVEAQGRQERTRPGPTRILIQSLRRFRGQDAPAVAAETAYYAILAIAPFLIFLIAAVATASQLFAVEVVDDLETTITRIAPGEISELLVPLFEEAIARADRGTTSFGMIASVVIALWSSSRAIGALLKGFNRVSDAEERPTAIWTRIVSLFLSVVMVGVLTLSVFVFLFGEAAGRGIARWFGLGGTFNLVWSVLSWPLVAVIVLLVLSVLYRYGTSAGADSERFISVGAVIATVLWILIMGGARVYLIVVEMGSLYGALGSFVVMTVLFFVMSLALLFGAAVNATVRSYSNGVD